MLTEAVTGNALSLKSKKTQQELSDAKNKGNVYLVYPSLATILGNENIHGVGSLAMPKTTTNCIVQTRRLDLPVGREESLLHAKVRLHSYFSLKEDNVY